ncbi:MAG: thiamine pyrophosphate-binding protein [Candidatus Bathyarchaeia archaeon]
MEGWRAIVEAIKAEEVELVFGLPTSRSLYSFIADVPEVRPILVRHECSGAFMAMAYARLSGKPGVCYGSPGPGVVNLVPGINEAYYTCTPVVALGAASSIKLEGMGEWHDCSELQAGQISMFKPITKWSVRISHSERLPWAMRRAFSIAANGKPGPVFVEIPSDVGLAKVEMPSYTRAIYPLRFTGDHEKVKAAADLIVKSERPVIVAGGGVVLSGAFQELIEFAELLAIPVLTTASGRGSIPEDHPLALGLVGLYRTKVGKMIYQRSDLLITIGSRNETESSGNWMYFPENARYIQIDIDPFEIGRNWVPDVAIVGDAKLVLRDLISATSAKIKIKNFESMPRVKELVRAKNEFEAEVEAECRTDAIPIKTKRIVRELNKVFGKDTILVNENGCQDLWSYYCPYYKVLNIGDCIPMDHQTCMGFGVAAAIGAKLTKPEKKVVCTTGDGAFQMFMKEMPTAVQYSAPVTWVVLNNFSLGWVKYIQRALNEKYCCVDFESQPNFVKLAEANACYGERVEKPAEIEVALKNALKKNKEGIPAVLDCIIDPWDVAEAFKEFHREVLNIPVK